MKRTLTVVLPIVFLSLLPLLAATSEPKIVGVDYVLALMDAGIDQKDIVRRIEERNLAFHLAPGDIDRLRAAGAGKQLIEVVTTEGAASGATAPPQDQGGTDADRWGRPSRLGSPQPEAAPDDGAEYNNQGTEGDSYGGYNAYPDYDYWPGYYGFVYSYGYPYPYYSYPHYYYPYRSYYFSAPYYSYPRHSFRGNPRGGGSWRGVPHGGGGGGGTPRSTPRGGGRPRSSPRGTHH